MMKKCSKGCCGSMISKTLLWIGGINWGLVGIGMFIGDKNWNVVNLIFGGIGKTPWLEALIYLLVGLSALMVMMGCRCKKCKGGSHSSGEGQAAGTCGMCGSSPCKCN